MSAADPQFSDFIHSPVRLRICALLRPADEIEFGVIRDSLGLSDAHLSKSLRALADAGILVLRKETSPARSDARKHTWAALTPAGRDAVERHLAALIALAAATAPRP